MMVPGSALRTLARMWSDRTRRQGPTQGMTLAELLMILAIVTVLLAIAVPRVAWYADRAAVRGAAAEAVGTFGAARHQAVLRRTTVAVRIDTAAGILSVRSHGRTLERRPLGPEYGVRLRATRDSTAYDARGLGYGAANLSLVVQRGAAAETVFVSRLGRVRR